MIVTETANRHGAFVAPSVDVLDVAALLAEIERHELISLPRLGAQIGLGEQSRKYAIRKGLIETAGPLAVENRYKGYAIKQDEAMTLLLAAALAVAAGVAIAVMLRGVKQAGLTGEAAASALRSISA